MHPCDQPNLRVFQQPPGSCSQGDVGSASVGVSAGREAVSRFLPGRERERVVFLEITDEIGEIACPCWAGPAWDSTGPLPHSRWKRRDQLRRHLRKTISGWSAACYYFRFEPPRPASSSAMLYNVLLLADARQVYEGRWLWLQWRRVLILFDVAQNSTTWPSQSCLQLDCQAHRRATRQGLSSHRSPVVSCLPVRLRLGVVSLSL